MLCPCVTTVETMYLYGTCTQWNITRLLKIVHLSQFNGVDETGAYQKEKHQYSILTHIYGI